MKVQIIKPPRRGKMFVTLTAAGYLFFSIRAVEEMNLSAKKSLLLAQDESGTLCLKPTDTSNPEAFPIKKLKTGPAQVTRICIASVLRRFGTQVDRSTRFDLVEADEGFYRVEGLKLGRKTIDQ